MNEIIQNILVYVAVILSAIFLLKKFLFKPAKPKHAQKACGNDTCGCH